MSPFRRIASGIVPIGVFKFLTKISEHSMSQPLNSPSTRVFSCRKNSACLPVRFEQQIKANVKSFMSKC